MPSGTATCHRHVIRRREPAVLQANALKTLGMTEESDNWESRDPRLSEGTLGKDG
jgi:hypothetical protein